jgi:zinc-binding alcohol dehydrogenase family protein
MNAVSFHQQLPIENPESLIDVVMDKPKPGPHDLLVQVRAISVNPVDTKIRKGSGPGQPSGELKILGWDAAGIVTEVGSDVSLFNVGDEVYYAGSLDRPGSYAEFQAVDERIVGRKPTSIDFADAGALPLTTITAWELLFDRMAVSTSSSIHGTLLIIGGAGGVGSIAIQLAKKLTGLKVSNRLLWARSQPERDGRDGRTTFSCRARLSRRALLSGHALSDLWREVELRFLLGNNTDCRFFAVEWIDFFEPFGDTLFHLG